MPRRRLIKWLLILLSAFVLYMLVQGHGFLSPRRIINHNISDRNDATINTVSKENEKTSTSQSSIYHKASVENKEETKSPSFGDIRTLLLFIGYPRSGSTLVGSILDAHPNIVIANEYHLFSHWETFADSQRTKDFICNQLWENSLQESKKLQRSKNTNYFFSYHVPGAWQGRFSGTIKIIGDKKAMSTTRFLSNLERSKAYIELKDVVNIPIKFLHVIRNPFDTVATMTLRAIYPGVRGKAQIHNLQFNNSEILSTQMEIYFKLVDKNLELRQRYGKNVLDVHYSSFIRQPKVWLNTICDFLEVFCDEDYLERCVKIIFPKETYTRRYVVWPEHLKQQIIDKIHQVSFLNGLAFDIT